MSSCLLAHVVIISGPAVALLYAVSVWLTYVSFIECTWDSKTKTLSLRLGLLIAAIACSIGLCESDKATTLVPIIGILLWAISVYLLYLTRVQDVVGIAHPPLYGPTRLKGKVVLITGANQGIGKETTLQLASMGATVVLLCRSETRAKQAMDDLCNNNTKGGGIDKTLLHFCPLDLGDFQSVRNAVEYIQTTLKLSKIDILINNAGLMMGTKSTSNDGYEMMMQANHLGHFLLTQLLMDQNLLNQNDARIMNVTSSTYQMSKTGFDFDDMFCETKRRPYTLFGQYSMTKLANVLFTKELGRRFPHYKVFAVHPGIVRTNVTSNMNWYWRVPNGMFAWYVATMQKTPQEGAYGSVFCAAAPTDQLPPTGSYMINCKPCHTNKFADSPDDAKRLWEVSERLVGIKEQK